jgi:hypothetical protein
LHCQPHLCLCSTCAAAHQVETHYPNDSAVYLALRNVDLACCAAFALEWAFWLWLAQRRLRYVFSLQSLVDLLTIGPTAASSLVNTRVSSSREHWDGVHGSSCRMFAHVQFIEASSIMWSTSM